MATARRGADMARRRPAARDMAKRRLAAAKCVEGRRRWNLESTPRMARRLFKRPGERTKMVTRQAGGA